MKDIIKRGLFDVGIVSKVYFDYKKSKLLGEFRSIVINNPRTSYLLAVYSEKSFSELSTVGQMVFVHCEPLMVWNKLNSNFKENKPAYHLRLIDYRLIEVDEFNALMSSID